MTNIKYRSTYYVERDPTRLDLPAYIDKPEYVTNKMAGYGLQAFGWMLWLWALLPLLTILLWWYQGTVIEAHLLSSDSESHLHHFKRLSLIILVLMFSFIGWATLDWYRFSKVVKEREMQKVSALDLANFFEVDPLELDDMQQAKVVIIHYSEEGKFVKAETYHA